MVYHLTLIEKKSNLPCSDCLNERNTILLLSKTYFGSIIQWHCKFCGVKLVTDLNKVLDDGI